MLWLKRTPAESKRTSSGFIVPCAPTILDHPPRGQNWIHEVKHDGYRIIARKDEGQVRLWTQLRIECGGRFEQITEAMRALPVASCTIDGDAVILRDDGHSDFYALGSDAGAARAVLIAFDLLELAGEDLRGQPIEERRARLASLLGGETKEPEALLFSEAFVYEGVLVFAQACAIGLEGVVSKRLGSSYSSGHSGDWIKTCNPNYRR